MTQPFQELIRGLRPECLVEPLDHDQVRTGITHAHQLLGRVADEVGRPAADDGLWVWLERDGDRDGGVLRSQSRQRFEHVHVPQVDAIEHADRGHESEARR